MSPFAILGLVIAGIGAVGLVVSVSTVLWVAFKSDRPEGV